jgi:hypothetical protein
LIDFQSGGHAGEERDQSFAVRFTRGEVAEHKFSIVPDARQALSLHRKNVECL